MKLSDERHSGWPLIIGIIVGVLALTAGPALAALTFSGTSISGSGAVVIDSSSTISIGTSTATGVTIGNGSGTVSFPGTVLITGSGSTYTVDPLIGTLFSTRLDVKGNLAGLADAGGQSVVIDTIISRPTLDVSKILNTAGGGIYPVGVESYPVLSGIKPDYIGAYSYDANMSLSNGIVVDDLWVYHANTPTLATGASVVNQYMLYFSDIAGAATNPYYSWFDSQGVRRVKEDSTVDGVGQAIEALYNPRFTKYTPGATDYERVVLGQWKNNVAEIGAEAGGTGTLRPLLLLGSQVGIGTGTSVPSTTFQIASASSTLRIGGTTACLEMANSNGSAGLNYITVLNGVLSATTTKPSACQ